MLADICKLPEDETLTMPSFWIWKA